jgi:Sigma-70, region 4
MATLESLPADQRAVLQLVLQRGRSYDEIAAMLSIDRAAVRERALAAFDALGPQTGVEPQRRALITDYLMGQLPPRVAEQTRDRLAEVSIERAWARVLAAELTQLAKDPLPEIPVEGDTRRPEAPAAPEPPARGEAEATMAEPEATMAEPEAAMAEPEAEPWASAPPAPEPVGAAATRRRLPPDYGAPDAEHPAARSSRKGGAILLGIMVVVAAVIVIVVVASGGSSKHHVAPTATASTPSTSTPTTGSTSTPTTGTSTNPQVIAQVPLTSPTGAKGTAGQAEVVKQGSQFGIVIVAAGVKPNNGHDAYAVWLFNSASDSKLLGFVNPGVKSNGRLQTAGVLPASASRFKQVLVTLETQGKPKAPGTVVLQGPLKVS